MQEYSKKLHEFIKGVWSMSAIKSNVTRRKSLASIGIWILLVIIDYILVSAIPQNILSNAL